MAIDQTNTPKLAVYEDGTLRRNTVLRNLVFAATPPRGLVVAKVSAASVARLRADVAALTAADLKGFFGPNEQPSAADSFLDVIEVGGASGCSHGLGDPASTCRTAAYSRVELDLVGLAGASEAAWRAAQAGTVSLGAEMKVAGDWPLADDGSGDGTMTLSSSQWQSVQAVGSDGLYRMPNGDFLQINVSTEDGNGNTLVYTTRMSAVVLGDDVAALRDELVANADRYEASRGEWLGIELGADRFPAFKYRELAVLPASGVQAGDRSLPLCDRAPRCARRRRARDPVNRSIPLDPRARSLLLRLLARAGAAEVAGVHAHAVGEGDAVSLVRAERLREFALEELSFGREREEHLRDRARLEARVELGT